MLCGVADVVSGSGKNDAAVPDDVGEECTFKEAQVVEVAYLEFGEEDIYGSVDVGEPDNGTKPPLREGLNAEDIERPHADEACHFEAEARRGEYVHP